MIESSRASPSVHCESSCTPGISDDALGDALGVRRQLDEARELAAARRYDVVDEQYDNDIGALKGKQRRGYQRVLELVRSGQVDHVVVWQTSRLLRNRRERAEAIELFSRHRVGILTVKGQDLDLSTAYGRGRAGLLGEFDTMESEVESERVAASAAERARAGRPSAYLGFGWTKEGAGRQARYSVNEAEAEVVREITRRLLANESLLGVTADLNRRKVDGPYVNTQARKQRAADGAADDADGREFTWGKGTVKKLALRASNAGLRVHHRGRATETLYPGDWPALIERADWERLTALLGDPSRNTNGNLVRPGARKHLLTFGIGECGVCGSVLRSGMRGSKGSRQPLYVCDRSDCVGRNIAKVDEWVSEVVIDRLLMPDALDFWLVDEDEDRSRANARVEELQAKLKKVNDRWMAGKMDDELYDSNTAQLAVQIRAARDEARRHPGPAGLSLVEKLRASDDPRATWDHWTVEQRRALLQLSRFRVVINRTRRGPGFREDDVVVDRQPKVRAWPQAGGSSHGGVLRPTRRLSKRDVLNMKFGSVKRG